MIRNSSDHIAKVCKRIQVFQPGIGDHRIDQGGEFHAKPVADVWKYEAMEYEPNPLARLTKTIHPDQTFVQSEYNAEYGYRLVQTTDEESNVSRSYITLGQVIEKTTPDEGMCRYVYDKNTYDVNFISGLDNFCQGRLTKAEVDEDGNNASEQTCTYRYDPYGRLIEKHKPGLDQTEGLPAGRTERFLFYKRHVFTVCLL